MGMSIRDKKGLIRIIVAFTLFVCVLASDIAVGLDTVFAGKFSWLLPFGLYFVIYILIGYDVLRKAARNILHGRIFDENFLMCIATLGAFALAIYRGLNGVEAEGFDEACAVLIFYQLGEWFQRYAAGRSRKSISALMDIRPDYANVKRGGEVVKAAPDEVAVGEIILVNPGEKVPLDGVVVKGASALDTMALTGESLPRDTGVREKIFSGCVNLTSQLEICVEKEYHDSTVSKILELVENASVKKSKAENFITKFAKYYTPTVIAVAVLLALIPSIVTGEWSVWVYRALSFLVVSCPCALVISVPLSFFCGIGAASRHGILVKGSNYLEKFNAANLFVFDKTGTLTKGNFALEHICPESRRDEILRLAAVAEQNSSHPIARSVVSAFGGKAEGGYTLNDVSGEGIIAVKGEDVILCGNEKLMQSHGIKFIRESGAGTVVYVAHNGEFIGSMLFADKIKDEAREVVRELDSLGCKTFMLTGDNKAIAEDVAGKLGISGYAASLMPQDKVGYVEQMLNDKGKKDILCFIGDGINDAPVLMRSDIGIAMGGVGSDAAIEASDIVLMKDDLKGLPLAKRIASKTMRIVFENIVFSLLVKTAILILSAFGIANMWIAVFGDVGVAILAILNAMRVNLGYDKKADMRASPASNDVL